MEIEKPMKGWICPKCGSIWSPTIPNCNCKCLLEEYGIYDSTARPLKVYNPSILIEVINKIKKEEGS